MSIPNRIWRVLRGRWLMADDDVRENLAAELAEYELAQASQHPSAGGATLPASAPPTPLNPRAAIPGRTIDPLAADLALLGAPPACDLPTLDRIYQERLSELDRDLAPEELESGRTALSEAYERLRDAINITETRFEKLEF